MSIILAYIIDVSIAYINLLLKNSSPILTEDKNRAIV